MSAGHFGEPCEDCGATVEAFTVALCYRCLIGDVMRGGTRTATVGTGAMA